MSHFYSIIILSKYLFFSYLCIQTISGIYKEYFEFSSIKIDSFLFLDKANIEISFTAHGHLRLIIDGHKFTRCSHSATESYWRCAQYQRHG